MNRLQVKDMPHGLASAARNQGYDDTHEMTCEEALRCWSEWEIGDPQWATDMLRLADEFEQRQDENGTYIAGPIKGQTSVSVLIGSDATRWLQHATKEIGYSFDELVWIAVEEAALNYAKANNLLGGSVE